MENKHSTLAPSSASIWGRCPGWVRMNAPLPPEEENPAAAEGTAAHEVGHRLLLQATGHKVNVLHVGDVASNGVMVTQEMFDNVKKYVEDVLRVLVMRPQHYGNEDRVEIPNIHPTCFGSVDFWALCNGELHIWDYKNGFKFVEVWENWQLSCYAAGLIHKFNLPPQTKVIFTIVQPRAFTAQGAVRRYTTTVAQLQPKIEGFRAAAARALSPNASVSTGPHCYYCRARHTCGPAISLGMNLIELMGEAVPVDLSPTALGKHLMVVDRAVEHLTSMQTALAEHVKVLMRQGVTVPGWSVKPAFGRETWAKPIDEVVSLGKLMGKDLSAPGVVTPAKARQMGIDPGLLRAYTHKPENGLKLVRDTGIDAARAFGGN